MPPTRTLYVPFWLACHVTVVETSDAPSSVFETLSIVTVGAAELTTVVESAEAGAASRLLALSTATV